MYPSADFDAPPFLNLDAPDRSGDANRVSDSARLCVPTITLATFLAFVLWDPGSSLLLATCAAANVLIILWASYRLYALDLLLSPMSSVLIGPGMVVYYSWGNLGARIGGEDRFSANPGSLEFYPLAALLTTIGLAIFCWVIFGLLPNATRYLRIRFADLEWRSWQALTAALFAAAVPFYLSLKYSFSNGYFRGIGGDSIMGQLDLWLSASVDYFVLLATIVCVSVMSRAASRSDWIFSVGGLLVQVAVAVGLRSRTFMLGMAITAALCRITLRPRRVLPVLTLTAASCLVLLVVGTMVKYENRSGPAKSILDNLRVATFSELETVRAANEESALLDRQYRMAGFELPAALLSSFDHGATPMFGRGMFDGLAGGLPNFLRTKLDGEFTTATERIAITTHFRNGTLLYGDSIGVPLTSGLADWGIAGVLIYALMAVYCLVLWRVVQAGPTLFTAYLMTGNGIMYADLFWDSNWVFAIRTIGFSWLVLLALKPLLAPRWLKPGEASPE